MSKTTFFFGQPIFGQLISLIDPNIISKASKACDADRYVKKKRIIETNIDNQAVKTVKNILVFLPDNSDFTNKYVIYLLAQKLARSRN